MGQVVSEQRGSRWLSFFQGLQRDFKLWLLAVLVLQSTRIVLIFLFRSRLVGSTGFDDILLSIAGGLRYDVTVAGYVAVLAVVTSSLCACIGWERPQKIVRGALAGLFIGLSLPMLPVSYGFFREFNDIFNEHIFGLIYDDQAATWASVADEYQGWVLVVLLAAVLVTATAIWLAVRWLRKPVLSEERSLRILAHRPVRIVLAVAALCFVVISVRGKVGRAGVDLKDAGITTDSTLNKLTVNGYMALKFAIERWRLLASTGGIEAFFPEEEIRERLRLLFPDAAPSDDLDDYLARTAGGPRGDAAPRHVFLIVVESLSCWPLLDEYESFGLASDLKELGEQGVLIKHFLSASTSSMTSLSAIFTGLPDAGAYTNYEPRSRRPYPTSIADILNRLGYRTRLFTGAYLTWQRIGEFAEHQGFEETYGAAHIEGGQRNPWGVDDRSLFEFVLKTVSKDDAPSFNVIFTVSNHPPYTVDLEDEGQEVKEIPEDLWPRMDPAYLDGGSRDHFLIKCGHYRYSQKTVVDFVRSVTKKLGSVAVAVTGDHVGRVYLTSTPTLFESSSVPCVLFGAGVPARGESPEIVGSHIDLIPTIVELVAPRGFVYHAMGRDLLGENPPEYAVGRDWYLGDSFICGVRRTPVLEPIPESSKPTVTPDIEELVRLHHSILGIGWWRIIRGESLSVPEVKGPR